MRFIVFGGGCYGSFYVRQLRRASEAGALALDRVVVIDRNPRCAAALEHGSDARFELLAGDWMDFGATLLDWPDPDDTYWVPAPVAPHVLFAWLCERLSGVAVPWGETGLGVPSDLPFAAIVRDSSLALSHAPGMCPIHCVEPRRCPITAGLRDWEMAETVHALLGERLDALEVFTCRHHVYGVGSIPLASIHAASARLSAVPCGARIGIATVSACHGVVDVMTRIRDGDRGCERAHDG